MYLMEVAKQLEAAASKLNSKARPGHIEYISKDRAAEWLLTIVKDLRAAQEHPTEKTEQQAKELYKRAFDGGAMATQTHLESLRVSQLEEENALLKREPITMELEAVAHANNKLRTENERLENWANEVREANLKLCEESDRLMVVNRDLNTQVQRCIEKARHLVEALREARNVLVVACGETAPYIKIALEQIDAALDDKRVSKHSRIFTEADGSSFLRKE